MDPVLVPSYGTSAMAARVTAQLQASLDYWVVPAWETHGWRLVYTGRAVDCYAPDADGCWDPGTRTISVALYASDGCVESAPLPHEIGHFVESPDHTDPRWFDFAPLLADYHAIPECSGHAPDDWPLDLPPR